MSARSRELLGLIPVSLLVSAGFAAVLVTQGERVQDVTLTYGLIFLGLCLFAHLFIRLRLPDADPYLFPLAALLAAFGLVVLYRIDTGLALRQAVPFVVALALFCATIVLLRDHHALERYRYLIALTGIVLLVMPRLPGIGSQVNGAFLAVSVGPVQFQPAEFAKIAIIVFLASYLRDTGDVLVRGSLRPISVPRQVLLLAVPAALAVAIGVGLGLGVAVTVLMVIFVVSLVAILRERPSLKHFGPLLLVWGLAMFMLLVIRDLGSSLMFFGGFLALLYVATARLSLIGVGATMFLGGATFLANTTSHVQDRIDLWLPLFAVAPEGPGSPGGAGQINQSLFAQADGGLFGRGLGRSLLELPRQFAGECDVPFPDCGSVLPAPHTDFIYAVIVSDLGLFGAAGLILCYLLFCARGFKTAMLASDGFSKLLAAGLTAVFALQVFVIVGGVTKIIPLTGVTLPFVSFGGSSIVANMVLLALLLIVSDSARRDRARIGQGGLV